MLVVKNLTASAGDLRDVGLIPGLGRSPGEGNGNPLQYSCLENPMDRGAWWATVHGVERVRHDLATKPPPPLSQHESLSLNGLCCPVRGSGNGISLSIFFFLIFGHTKWHLGQSTSGILVPWPGIEPTAPALDHPGRLSRRNLHLCVSYFESDWACFDGLISYLGLFSLELLVFSSLMGENSLNVTESVFLWGESQILPQYAVYLFTLCPPLTAKHLPFIFMRLDISISGFCIVLRMIQFTDCFFFFLLLLVVLWFLYFLKL